MLKLQFDLSTGKIEQFEAKCCDHDFGGDCRCCCNECENCLEAQWRAISHPLRGEGWHSPKQLKESEKEGDQMTTQQCEECFDLFATASEYLSHKNKEHKEEEE